MKVCFCVRRTWRGGATCGMGAVLIPRFINTVNCVAHDRQETETGTGASETKEVTTKKKKKMAEGKGDGWGQCKPAIDKD